MIPSVLSLFNLTRNSQKRTCFIFNLNRTFACLLCWRVYKYASRFNNVSWKTRSRLNFSRKYIFARWGHWELLLNLFLKFLKLFLNEIIDKGWAYKVITTGIRNIISILSSLFTSSSYFNLFSLINEELLGKLSSRIRLTCVLRNTSFLYWRFYMVE